MERRTMPGKYTFKQLIKMVSEAETEEEGNRILAATDRSYQAEKITFADSELIYNLISKITFTKHEKLYAFEVEYEDGFRYGFGADLSDSSLQNERKKAEEYADKLDVELEFGKEHGEIKKIEEKWCIREAPTK